MVFALALSAVSGVAGAEETPVEPGPSLEIQIETPEMDATIGSRDARVLVSGKVDGRFGEPLALDLLLVIDTSESTEKSSGADIDGDGTIGGREDGTLAAEVAGLRALIRRLDPATTRVGLVAFSGDNEALTPDAYTAEPLTYDYARVERRLDSLLRRGSFGGTNLLSAVNLATIELLGLKSAKSTKREGASRLIVFLSDGQPTLPFENSPLQNARLTVQSAVKVGMLGVRVDAFMLGQKGAATPVVLSEMARVTRGVFTPVPDPGDLRVALTSAKFAGVDRFEVCNTTTGTRGSGLALLGDGSFSTLLELAVGKNTIEVAARSMDGSKRIETFSVEFSPGASEQLLSSTLLKARDELANRQTDVPCSPGRPWAGGSNDWR